MADKLSLYNQALGHLQERRLVSLGENREPRRVLDTFWPIAVKYCFEQGLWKFMKRVIQADASETVKPQFGYGFAFAIPPDWVRTLIISTVETLDPPLLQVGEEAGYWFADWTPLFISFISSDPLYGNNMALWSGTFEHYVSVRLAVLAAPRLAVNRELLADLRTEEKRARVNARANDAMNDPPGFAPTGSWVRSRRGWTVGLPGSGGGDGSGPGIP